MDSSYQLRTDADLERLATVLDPRDYVTSLVLRQGAPPCLTVSSRLVPILSEEIYARHGWYWWSWSEQIAPTDQVHTAAGRIASVLGLPQPSTAADT